MLNNYLMLTTTNSKLQETLFNSRMPTIRFLIFLKKKEITNLESIFKEKTRTSTFFLREMVEVEAEEAETIRIPEETKESEV